MQNKIQRLFVYLKTPGVSLRWVQRVRTLGGPRGRSWRRILLPCCSHTHAQVSSPAISFNARVSFAERSLCPAESFKAQASS